MKISVTILTKNNEKYLKQVLDSTLSFDEVLIYDNGSTDKTLDIASEYPNVNIKKGPFLGFGRSHNKATELAKNDWILSIDSDEIVSSELIKEIEKTPLNTNHVYSFPRHNYYNEKFIKWCGWYPDRQYRLYNRKSTRFTDAEVHEQIIVDKLHHTQLQQPIIHYSYSSISDFLDKMQNYSELFAKENRGKRRSSPCKAVLHGLFTFFKCYILKRGFLGGYEGLLISAYNGHTAFYKYMKLYEANRSTNATQPGEPVLAERDAECKSVDSQ
ncbi:MAG: glycosyltransferase family 2 protein [Chlamydiota bacterium]|nr:glycosyltransferase family 2 protein [Chlamydiota bacterium]